MTTKEKQINQIGYARNPNNIYSINGTGWYPGGPGLVELPAGHEVYVINEQYHIINTMFAGLEYKTVAIVDTIEGFKAHCTRISEPGVCGNDITNSWN